MRIGILTKEKKQYYQLLQILFKQVLKQQRQILIYGKRGQTLFYPSRAVIHRDKKLEIWPGVECLLSYHSENKFYTLIVDSAYKIIHQQTIQDEINRIKEKNEQYNQLVGQIVMTNYNKKFYKIEGVNLNMNPLTTFTDDKGKTYSFVEYYKTKYNIDIKVTSDPLLDVKLFDDKKLLGDYNQLRIVQLIPELCRMTGLKDEIRTNFQFMKMISLTTKPSCQVRYQEANQFVKQLQEQLVDSNGLRYQNMFHQWRVMIHPTPLQFPEKYLSSGSLIMGNNKLVDIQAPNFVRAAQQPMLKNGKMKNWCVFYGKKDEGPSIVFLDELIKANKDLKLGIDQPMVHTIQNSKIFDEWMNSMQQAIKDFLGSENIGFFLFILPGAKKKAPLYDQIKQACIQKFSIPSQVILFDTIKNCKGLRSICNKLIVQIVAKTGGVPWSISDIPLNFSKTPTMVVGYDIYHKKDKQSLLAFCSSIDYLFGRYHSQNIPSGEFNTNLQPLLTNSINIFQEINKTKPQNIIIFRDGVGDCQEQIIFEQEIAQFKKAIQENGFPSKLIFILTNKRISVKFYTISLDNPQSGFIVDNMITKANDFYLISQQTNLGTVTPTHYKILHNDLSDVQGFFLLEIFNVLFCDITGIINQIQLFAFKLSYLYYNQTGSIKSPNCVRYAHCCSNFIGERQTSNESKQFLPNVNLLKNNTLYFI